MLTDDDARAQVVAEAREHVLQFDWGEVSRRTQALYASLAPIATLPSSAGSTLQTDSLR